jgi:hypothetical protein
MIRMLGAIANRVMNPFGLQVSRLQSRLSLPPMHYRFVSRFMYLQDVFKQISHLEGNVVECGVGRGRSFLYLSYLVHTENKNRMLWGFDSFEGFPEPTAEDESIRNPKKGDWSDTSELDIRNLLLTSELPPEFVSQQIVLVKGFFETSLEHYSGDKIALLHVDVDLYQSYLTVLETLYPRVVEGGVLLFDEYSEEAVKWPGAQKAIDEFLGESSSSICRDELTGKHYLIKNSG